MRIIKISVILTFLYLFSVMAVMFIKTLLYVQSLPIVNDPKTFMHTFDSKHQPVANLHSRCSPFVIACEYSYAPAPFFPPLRSLELIWLRAAGVDNYNVIIIDRFWNVFWYEPSEGKVYGPYRSLKAVTE